MNLKVILESSEEGGFTVYIPALPGCISEGENIQECMENIREAASLYLETAEDDFLPDKNFQVKELAL